MNFSDLIGNARRFLQPGRPNRSPRGSRQRRLSLESLETRNLLSGLPALPTGLVTVISNNDSNSDPVSEAVFQQELQTITNPSISGVAFQIDWKDIEPNQPSNPLAPTAADLDLTRLNELFAAADKSGKWVQLLIFPGFFSPSWITAKGSGVTTETFKVQYGPQEHLKSLPLPLPYDPTYLDDWSAFLKVIGTQYGSNREFSMIAAAGPTSVSDEFTEPDSSQTDTNKWLELQFTPEKYDAAWAYMFGQYETDFPNQYVSLSDGTGVPTIKADGTEVSGTHAQQVAEKAANIAATRTMLVAEASADLEPGQFAFQSSALTGNPDYHASAIKFVISEIGNTVVTGFQLQGSCEQAPASQGAPGDPPLALVRSIDNGMQLNAPQNQGGQHVDYIEVQASDVEASDLQPVLQWAASLFPREKALNVFMTSQGKAGSSGFLNTTVTVSFSVPVTNFTASDLEISNGYVTSFTKVNDTTYTFVLAPDVLGFPTTVNIAAGTVEDKDGDLNTSAPQIEFDFYITKPGTPPPPKF